MKSHILLSALALTASAVLATAQDAANQNQADRPDRGERGDRRGNPEEFRQRMAERMKTALKVSDEEWTVLQPLIEKVSTKQREAMGGRFGGGGPRGGGGGGDQGGRSDRGGGGSPESQALRTALENESTPPAELKTKLDAVRASRAKAAAELAAAREELKKVVSVRQEAVLVSMGMLD